MSGTDSSKPGSPLKSSVRKQDLDVIQPSSKYKDVEISKVLVTRATSPPKPTLPRRPEGRSWNATQKERQPLTSNLTGPGRAGKYGELIGETGGKYCGEVLAGRPQGQGEYYTQKPSGEWVLRYSGSWVQGRREGPGTKHFGEDEVYNGHFVEGMRHGEGRHEYSSGDVYTGQWADDKRHGHGTLVTQAGDIFVGTYLRDRREGLGTLYLMSRQRKYVAEYVNDQPKCGSYMDLDDADLAPLNDMLARLSLRSKLQRLATEDEPVAPLPALQLQQPSKVLAEEFSAVRRERTTATADLRNLQEASGTLSEREVEMLRHSFTLMAAGDDPKVGLLAHQLRELCVMAGLDPAAATTRALVERLVAARNPHTGRLTFDSFVKVCVFFQEEPVAGVAERTLLDSLDHQERRRRSVSPQPQA